MTACKSEFRAEERGQLSGTFRVEVSIEEENVENTKFLIPRYRMNVKFVRLINCP